MSPTSVDDVEQALFTPLRPTGATIPNSAMWARMALITEVVLADEELARTVEHQAALLLGRLGLDKPHVGPGHRFTDGLGVSCIVLLSLDVRLHIGLAASAAPYAQASSSRDQ